MEARMGTHAAANEIADSPMTAGPFELTTQVLGPLPIIDSFCDRLGLAGLLETFVPHDDARLKLAPAAAIGVVVRNLVIGREPVYALGEWAAGFDPALLGLASDETGLLNDDRVGRMLARLFDADRASMLTRLVLDAVARFGIDCSQLHNDSTSVTFTGGYYGWREPLFRCGVSHCSVSR